MSDIFRHTIEPRAYYQTRGPKSLPHSRLLIGRHACGSRVDLLSVVFSRARGGAERVPLAAERLV